MMINNGLVIGIDGLSGAGKSTLAKILKNKHKNIIHVEMSNLYVLYAQWYAFLKEQNYTRQEILDFFDTYLKVNYRIVRREVIFSVNFGLPVINDSIFNIKNLLKELLTKDEFKKLVYKQIRKVIKEISIDYAVVLTGRELQKVYPNMDYFFMLTLDEEIRIMRLMKRENISEEEAKIRNVERKIYNFSKDTILVNSGRLSPRKISNLVENVVLTSKKKDRIIKVNFLGTTSSGKTTICQYAAKMYKEPYSTEFLRDYGEKHHLTVEDAVNIPLETWCDVLDEQLAFEKNSEKLAKKYFFADSGAITAALDWNLIEYPRMKELVNQQLTDAEVIFVCDNNIDFVQDELRGDSKKSQKLNDKIIEYLTSNNVPYIILTGTVEERFKTIQQILSKF